MLSFFYRDRSERIPTRVFDDEWIYTHPYDDALRGKETFGKWLVFRNYTELDSVWQLIKEHVFNGDLGAKAAKCSTMLKTETRFDDITGVICVYTAKEDIDQVGLKLIRLVGDEKLHYKTDAASLRNVYRIYGAPKTTYKTLLWNNGDPKFIFDNRYGKWFIKCTRHDNLDSMWQRIRQAAEDGVLGDVYSVQVFRSSADNVSNISVGTTEEDVEKVGDNLITIVKRDIHFKTTNMCAGMQKKIHFQWNEGKPQFTCKEFI